MSERTWIVENKWICSSCQAENLGRHMECQACRNPKDKSEKDILSGPSAPPVSDAELLRQAQQGPNWVCAFCEGQVRNEHGKCVNGCGAPRPAEPSTPAPRPLPTGVPGPGVPRYPSWDSPSFFSVRFWMDKRVLISMGAFALVMILVFFIVPREVTAKVDRLHWSRTALLRQRTLMHGEGWGTPFGSFNSSCASKYYGDERCRPYQCRPHSVSYECNCTSRSCDCRTSCSDNGNGFSTCKERCSTCRTCSTCTRTEYDTCYETCPVYRDWCSYDYYEWPQIAAQETSGTEHDEHWPELQATSVEQRLERYERFEVAFVEASEAKESWTLKPDTLEDFRKFEPKQLWRIRVNRLGLVTPMRKLE